MVFSVEMGWVSGYLERPPRGETVSFRPRGQSTPPTIASSQLWRVAPAEAGMLAAGDMVLCKVKGSEYLHLLKAIEDNRFPSGNNRGSINGWIGANAICGRPLHVEP